MSIKTGKKLGFIMALSMLVGSVVGIGIFFKSHGILRANDWNGTGTFIAWLLGGLLSLGAAISFSEISTFKTERVHGLPAWAEKIGGKKFGYFVRFNYSFFWLGIVGSVLGVFGSEMIFSIITAFSDHEMKDFPVYAHIIIGFGISIMFFLLNYLSTRAGGWVQTISTILKWIPLLLVAVLGIALVSTNNVPTSGKQAFGHNAFTNGHSFTFVGMLASLPAVLFAFDAFLNVGSLRSKMKNPEKMPMVVLVGMISVLALYLLTALSAILHGSGMVSGLPFGKGYSKAGVGIFDQIFSGDTSIAMGKFVIVFITISTLGAINGMAAASIAVHEQAIESNTMFGFKTMSKRFGNNRVLLGYGLLLILFWTLVFGIPASVLNSDSIVDGLSNFPTLFFFGLYGMIILLYTLKRKTFETKKMNKILFNTFAWISIIGIGFVVIYQLTYGFVIDAIIHPAETMHWGLYAGDNNRDGALAVNFPGTSDIDFGVYMSKLQGMIVFGSFLVAFTAIPLVNMILTKKFEDNNVITNTQIKSTI